MGIINSLAGYIYEEKYENIPERVIKVAKERFLDYLGTAIDATERMPMDRVITVVKKYSGKGGASVIGKRGKMPMPLAALVNSHYSISDGWAFIAQHQAMVIFPVAMAVSENLRNKKRISGEDFLTGIIVGYEVMMRVGEAMSPSIIKRGFSSTSMVGPMGAAATAGKLMGLKREEIENALSIASILGCGFQATDRAPHPLLSFQTGRASEGGIIATLLAKEGLLGSGEIFEEGFLPALSDEYDKEKILMGLGKEYKIVNTYVKIHGGCRALATPIDVVISMKEKFGIEWKEVEKIIVRNRSRALIMEIEKPKSGRQAEYSMAFGVAIAIIYGDANLDRFEDHILRSNEVREIMNRVEIKHDPDLDNAPNNKRPTIVEIIMKNGERYEDRSDIAKGEPDNPLFEKEMIDKFNEMASKVLGKNKIKKIVMNISGLEKLEKMDVLFPLIRG